MRKDGTIFTFEHIDYINSVIDKLNNLTNETVSYLQVDKTNAFDPNDEIKVSSRGVVNGVPAYLLNAVKSLGDSKITYTTREKHFNLSETDTPTHVYIDAPDEYTGNMSFSKVLVKINTKNWNATDKPLTKVVAETYKPATEFLIRHLKSGDFSFMVSDMAKQVQLTAQVSDGLILKGADFVMAPDLKNMEFKLVTTFYKYGANK